MDLLATFAENPLRPALWAGRRRAPAALAAPMRWIEGARGRRRDRP